MKKEHLWFVMGVAVGYLVLPRVQAMLAARRAPAAAAAA